MNWYNFDKIQEEFGDWLLLDEGTQTQSAKVGDRTTCPYCKQEVVLIQEPGEPYPHCPKCKGN